jgi:hypothetical protein
MLILVLSDGPLDVANVLTSIDIYVDGQATRISLRVIDPLGRAGFFSVTISGLPVSYPKTFLVSTTLDARDNVGGIS